MTGETKPRQDELEQAVADALTAAGIRFTTPDERRDATGLDFRLETGVEIEVKRMHSERVDRQLASAPNVILLQGPLAVSLFCGLLGFCKI
jgi:hypothetical protein